jgi:hypothetical protein
MSMALPTLYPVHDHPGETACLGHGRYLVAQIAGA